MTRRSYTCSPTYRGRPTLSDAVFSSNSHPVHDQARLAGFQDTLEEPASEVKVFTVVLPHVRSSLVKSNRIKRKRREVRGVTQDGRRPEVNNP
jgi:hypothetical protein